MAVTSNRDFFHWEIRDAGRDFFHCWSPAWKTRQTRMRRNFRRMTTTFCAPTTNCLWNKALTTTPTLTAKVSDAVDATNTLAWYDLTPTQATGGGNLSPWWLCKISVIKSFCNLYVLPVFRYKAIKWILSSRKTASEMTCIVSSGALNSTHSLTDFTAADVNGYESRT